MSVSIRGRNNDGRVYDKYEMKLNRIVDANICEHVNSCTDIKKNNRKTDPLLPLLPYQAQQNINYIKSHNDRHNTNNITSHIVSKGR